MPSREYRDLKGVLWEVFEVHRLNDRPNSVRPALSSGWLAFVSETEKRRLPEYPQDWLQLSDDELQELLNAAFLAPDPAYPVPRAGGALPSPPDASNAQRHVDRRKRPRPALTSPTVASARVEPDPQPSVTTVSTPPVAGGAGLPVPPPATVSGSLGSVGIETLVRLHARQARKNGVAIIEGMIGVKRALADAGEDITPETLRQLRKVFVDEFYFAR